MKIERNALFDTITRAWAGSLRDAGKHYAVPPEFFSKCATAIVSYLDLEAEAERTTPVPPYTSRGETIIDISGGKYTVIHQGGSNLRVLRNGEKWDRDFIGDKLVLGMAQEIESARSERDAANKSADEVNAKLIEHARKAEETETRLRMESRAYQSAFHKCLDYTQLRDWQRIATEAQTEISTWSRAEAKQTVFSAHGVSTDETNSAAVAVEIKRQQDWRAAQPAAAADAIREAVENVESPPSDAPTYVALTENMRDFAVSVAQHTTGALLLDMMGVEVTDTIGMLSEMAITFAEASEDNVAAVKARAKKVGGMLDALNLYASSLSGSREGKLLASYVEKLRELCL